MRSFMDVMDGEGREGVREERGGRVEGES